MNADGRHRDRRRGPDQILRREKGRRQFHDAGRARAHPRLSRPQRQRQDHDDPHAVRPADAGRRARRPVLATTSSRQQARDQAPRRLYDAAIFALWRSHHSRKSGVRRAHLRPATIRASAARAALERLGLRRARRSARRRTVRRLEAAAGAWRLHPARARAAAARRAHRRRRSQGATRLLGRDPSSRRRRASRCSSRRITWTRPNAVTGSPISPTAGCWLRARPPRSSPARGSSTYVVTGAGSRCELSERLSRDAGVDMVALFGMALHVGGRDAARLDEIAPRF